MDDITAVAGSHNQGYAAPGPGPLRPDFLPKDAYLSRDFLEQEKRKLWPKIWQVACRLEEIPSQGDFVVYDICDESIIVVRTGADKIQAFHNVCQHRGRRLKDDACGNTSAFQCRFHGWRWKLDGSLDRVVDREDWAGCTAFADDDLRLKPVLADHWGGFVFINLDVSAEPLAEFLHPMPQFIDPFELHTMRFRWYKTAIVPCNWKAALEAFNEAYHVSSTHPQLLDTIGQDITNPFLFGKHAMFAYPQNERPFGTPSPRTGKPVPQDLRPGLVRYFAEIERTLKAPMSPRSAEAAARLLTEVPADATPYEVLGKLMMFQKEAAIASGAGWPEISFEQMAKAGTNWNVFPNLVFMMTPDGLLAYRSRPNGDDPDSCVYDFWSLVRYPPGMEPPLEREFYADPYEDTVEKFGLVLAQDIVNMRQVQKGMKSSGFTGARTNPKQEASVSNLHRVVNEYLYAS